METDFTMQYQRWHDNLLQNSAAMDYLIKKCGLTQGTIDHFCLGYDAAWQSPEDLDGRYTAPRIIIPYGSQFYRARRMDGRTEMEYLSCGQGTKVFNAAAFNDDTVDSGSAVWVLTGDMDCMMLWQRGYKGVVSIGHTDGLSDFVKEAEDHNPQATYILALDNDALGRAEQMELAKQMRAAGLHFVSADTEELYGQYKNICDAGDDSTFWGNVSEYTFKGFEERNEREEASKRMVDDFLDTVQTHRFKPIPTGIDCIDNAIGGGLIRQQLVMLAAGPGMGKTSLASQICENIAADGQDHYALYFNFEMSREQLLARSLARIAWEPVPDGVTNSSNIPQNSKKLTALDILQGYSWTDNEKEIIYKAADRYKSTVAGHMMYNPGTDDTTDITSIVDRMDEEKKRTGRAPDVVCIDYLQLLTDRENDDVTATIRHAMMAFKDWAIKNNAVVIIITATNRGSMKTGDSGLNSGRDTSNIEYGADLHLGLVYTAIGEGAEIKDISAAKEAYYDNPTDENARKKYKKLCTRYTLKVNKGRFSPDGKRALLHFDGSRGLFTPADVKLNKQTETQKESTTAPALTRGRRKR